MYVIQTHVQARLAPKILGLPMIVFFTTVSHNTAVGTQKVCVGYEAGNNVTTGTQNAPMGARFGLRIFA